MTLLEDIAKCAQITERRISQQVFSHKGNSCVSRPAPAPPSNSLTYFSRYQLIYFYRRTHLQQAMQQWTARMAARSANKKHVRKLFVLLISPSSCLPLIPSTPSYAASCFTFIVVHPRPPPYPHLNIRISRSLLGCPSLANYTLSSPVSLSAALFARGRTTSRSASTRKWYVGFSLY